MLPVTLEDRLRELQGDRDMISFSKDIGVSISNLSTWYGFGYSSMQLRILNRIAQRLGYDPFVLTRDDTVVRVHAQRIPKQLAGSLSHLLVAQVSPYSSVRRVDELARQISFVPQYLVDME